MSLETLLEAARYVELQEAQQLQQSSSALSSFARGTAGMLEVGVIALKCAFIAGMLGIQFVYVCYCTLHFRAVTYAKYWKYQNYKVQVSCSDCRRTNH